MGKDWDRVGGGGKVIHTQVVILVIFYQEIEVMPRTSHLFNMNRALKLFVLFNI